MSARERWLIDTSVLIDHLRGVRSATQVLIDGRKHDHELWSSVVTRTEIITGMRANEKQATYDLFDLLRWQEVSEEIADRAGELAMQYHRSHSHMDLADYILAATAAELDAQLLTLNVRHFPMFPDLSKPY